MWNCYAPSSLLLPLSDDYVKCEASNSPARTTDFERMLAAAPDYDLFRHMSFSPPPENLQSPTLFTTRSSENYLGENSIYGAVARPPYTQLSYPQPTAATATFTPVTVILFTYLKTLHLARWTAASEPMIPDGDGSGFRSSKRLKTATTATTQNPRHGLKCHAKPRNQPAKAACKRSQKLGDKITALQQLVSPYGKTDTASVLHEAAACIRQLHHQIQILTAPYSGTSPSSSSASQQDAGGGGGATTELRRRGLCVAALSPAVVSLVAEGAANGHRRADVEDQRRSWFSGQ
uniref:BHLH domain-containing protein n=1 Tax=Leersia perrieri TaxID=77586 RepID=A0A0D9VSK7_9ORYZ